MVYGIYFFLTVHVKTQVLTIFGITHPHLHSPIYRLALVVPLTSPPSLERHHVLFYADLRSRLVILFKLYFVQPVVINMLAEKSQISITVVESGSNLFVVFMPDGQSVYSRKCFEFYSICKIGNPDKVAR